MLSHLAHVFDFKMIERHVMEAVERSTHQQPDTGPDSRFRGPKSEPLLRTCVYSRYARLKAKTCKWFCRSQATSGLAVDYR